MAFDLGDMIPFKITLKYYFGRSYNKALLFILSCMIASIDLLSYGNFHCLAYSGDDLYLRHKWIDKFDIIQSNEIVWSKSISKRSTKEQLLHDKNLLSQHEKSPDYESDASADYQKRYTEGDTNKQPDKIDAIYQSIFQDYPKRVHFNSLGKRFHLVLDRPTNLVTDDITITTLDSNNKATKVPFNRNDLQVMDGYLDGEARSLALASFSQTSNKLLTAQIFTDNDTIIVEPAYMHRNELSLITGTLGQNFDDSYIYNESMIIYNLRDHRQFYPDGLSDNEIHGNKSAYDIGKLCGAIKLNDTKLNFLEPNNSSALDDLEASIRKTFENRTKKSARFRRDIGFPATQSRDKTRCTLHLVADYLFYKHVGNGDLQTTVNYLLALINRVNLIYLPTVWILGDDELDVVTNIGFTVQNITIHQEYTKILPGGDHYNMERDKLWGAREFLNNFAYNSPPHHYCLAHLLTYRKFDTPVLGLAYVASPRFGTIGGICSPTQQRGDIQYKHNSGVSTSIGINGETLITRQTDLVLAHELGHNLGAEHDTDECRSDTTDDGAYLMHPFSVMGFKKNNRIFSQCSRLAIGRVIKRKSSCFVGVVYNVCGNGIVEGDEECDDGVSQSSCCDSFCRLTPGSQCSDRDWCCSGCHIVAAGRSCGPAEEYNCKDSAYCNGTSSKCPPAPPVENGKTCVGRGSCKDGECVPFCDARQLHSCLCNTPADACKLCCKSSINGTCVPYDVKASYLPDGVLCYKGFCEKGRCKQPIQDLVERLWDVVEDINFTTLGKFFRDNIILVVLLASIPIWCVITHYINEFDRKIKQDVISALRKNNSRRRRPLSKSPFLPCLFVGDGASANSADDIQNPRNEFLQPLKQSGQSNNFNFVQEHNLATIGFRPPLAGFQLPLGEEIVIETRNPIPTNITELPHDEEKFNSSFNGNNGNLSPNADMTVYSTQV